MKQKKEYQKILENLENHKYGKVSELFLYSNDLEFNLIIFSMYLIKWTEEKLFTTPDLQKKLDSLIDFYIQSIMIFEWTQDKSVLIQLFQYVLQNIKPKWNPNPNIDKTLKEIDDYFVYLYRETDPVEIFSLEIRELLHEFKIKEARDLFTHYRKPIYQDVEYTFYDGGRETHYNDEIEIKLEELEDDIKEYENFEKGEVDYYQLALKYKFNIDFNIINYLNYLVITQEFKKAHKILLTMGKSLRSKKNTYYDERIAPDLLKISIQIGDLELIEIYLKNLLDNDFQNHIHLLFTTCNKYNLLKKEFKLKLKEYILKESMRLEDLTTLTFIIKWNNKFNYKKYVKKIYHFHKAERDFSYRMLTKYYFDKEEQGKQDEDFADESEFRHKYFSDKKKFRLALYLYILNFFPEKTFLKRLLCSNFGEILPFFIHKSNNQEIINILKSYIEFRLWFR